MSDRSDREEIGQRIRALRKARDLSLNRLADASGISPGYLSDVERGISSPSGEKLARVAAELDVTTDYLLTGRAEPTFVEIPAGLAAAAETLNLSYTHTMRLLAGKQSLVARRSATGGSDDWTKEKWIDFHNKVKHLL